MSETNGRLDQVMRETAREVAREEMVNVLGGILDVLISALKTSGFALPRTTAAAVQAAPRPPARKKTTAPAKKPQPKPKAAAAPKAAPKKKTPPKAPAPPPPITPEMIKAVTDHLTHEAQRSEDVRKLSGLERPIYRRVLTKIGGMLAHGGDRRTATIALREGATHDAANGAIVPPPAASGPAADASPAE